MEPENENIAFVVKRHGRTDIFEVCKEFPKGYVVWNIGRENFPFEGYVPLAKPILYPPNHIELKTLKTIKVSEDFALWLLKIASKGTYGSIDKQKFHKLYKQFYEQKGKIIV